MDKKRELVSGLQFKCSLLIVKNQIHAYEDVYT
jgi:hypothetical protein